MRLTFYCDLEKTIRHKNHIKTHR